MVRGVVSSMHPDQGSNFLSMQANASKLSLAAVGLVPWRGYSFERKINVCNFHGLPPQPLPVLTRLISYD